MLKQRGPLRHPMPPWVVALQAIEQAQHFAGPLPGGADRCICCRSVPKGSRVGPLDVGDGVSEHDLDLFICSSCGCIYHKLCSCGIAHLQSRAWPQIRDDEGERWLCPMC